MYNSSVVCAHSCMLDWLFIWIAIVNFMTKRIWLQVCGLHKVIIFDCCSQIKYNLKNIKVQKNLTKNTMKF